MNATTADLSAETKRILTHLRVRAARAELDLLHAANIRAAAERRGSAKLDRAYAAEQLAHARWLEAHTAHEQAIRIAYQVGYAAAVPSSPLPVEG